MGRGDFELTHWHLDTFLLEYKPWKKREFVTFRIDPGGSIRSVEMLGDSFERLADE